LLRPLELQRRSKVVERFVEPEILSLTPSKVRDYQACPQQYRLKAVTRLAGGDTSPALSFGSSIHAALEDLYKGTLPAHLTGNCYDILRRHWRAKDYGDQRESELYFNRGLEALSRYVEVMGQPAGQIIGTELYLSRVIRLGDIRVRLGCKVDRLELHPDGLLEALDYKTNGSGQVPTREFLAADLATFIYYVLVRISYPERPCVIVSQLNVLTLAKVEVDYDEARLAAHKQSLIKLVQAIESSAFEPRPSIVCSWCRVKNHCPVSGEYVDLDSFI
jgi:putative RecB family exonuclease